MAARHAPQVPNNVDWQRRRVLGALGSAGFTAAIGGCASWPVDAPRGLARATAVNHLSYAVTDYARTRDFYVEMLGMKVAWDNGRMCSVEFGDPAKPEGIYIVPVKPGEKAAVSHIGYSVENFPANKEKIAAELTRQNIKFKADTEWGWTLDDRAGYMIHFISETGIFPGASDPCAIINSDKCKGAEAAGLKNLAAAPKPSGRGFKATAFSHIVLCVDDIVKTRDWYEQMFSMRPIYYKAEEPNAQAMLRFGNNTLYLRNIKRPGGKFRTRKACASKSPDAACRNTSRRNARGAPPIVRAARAAELLRRRSATAQAQATSFCSPAITRSIALLSCSRL